MPLIKKATNRTDEDDSDIVHYGNETKKVWTYDNSTVEAQKAKIEELKKYASESIDARDKKGRKIFSLERLKKNYKLTKLKNEGIFEVE